MADSEKKEEKKEVKIKPKTIINYIEIGGKTRLSLVVVDKKGDVKKIKEEDDDALKVLKKFVNAL